MKLILFQKLGEIRQSPRLWLESRRNEPQDRKRWIMVGTLKPGFQMRSPRTAFTGTIGKYLDDPADSDRIEVERIAGSIEALRRHNKRHAKLGHGFGFTTINPESRRVPTIVRSYHKINIGPFVETATGLRFGSTNCAGRNGCVKS